MELEECDRCGDEYPRSWGSCPSCDCGDRPDLKPRFREDDEWN